MHDQAANPPTEMQLLQAARTGDRLAFTRLVRDCGPMLERLALRMLGQPADAEDVTQDVLLRLHQRSAELRDAERAEAWVFAIARHAIADYYRAKSRQPSIEETTEELADPEVAGLPGFASFEGDHSIHEEVLSWLRPLVDGLPDKYREALLLADFEHLPQKNVAERLGLSLSGAKSRVQRARTMLGELLGLCCDVELGSDGKAVDFKRNCDC